MDRVRAIATQTREDFTTGAVSADEIIAAAVANNSLDSIATFVRDRSGDAIKVGSEFVLLPIYKPETFPDRCCDIATVVLKQRLDAVDALEGNQAIPIIGGYGENPDGPDVTSVYHNYHRFLGIGNTALGPDTIVDITADQFEGMEEPVYLGPLLKPWTDRPHIAEWDIY